MAAMPHPRPHPPDLSSAQRADVLAVANQSAAALMRAYGAFALPVHIELDALRVEALVRVCGAQIRRRALDTPLLFSPLALSLSSEGCTSLLRSYLGLPAGLDILPNPRNSSSALPHVPPPEQPIPPAFAQECTFANPVDLAALIKWALSRIGKVVPVPAVASSAGSEPQTLYVQHRGFLLLDMYGQWRATERRKYLFSNPPVHHRVLLLLTANGRFVRNWFLSACVLAICVTTGCQRAPPAADALLSVIIYGVILAQQRHDTVSPWPHLRSPPFRPT